VAVRTRAMLALARLERLDATPLVLATLADAAPDVREAAAFAAGQLDLALAGAGSADAHATALRGQVQAALLARLAAEDTPAVRGAVIRALGRVGDGTALKQLIQVAQDPGQSAVLRAEALRAIGVAATRRPPTLSADPALAAVVHAALKDSPALAPAAAYAAFRQGLALDATALAAPALAGGDEEAREGRIALARALGQATTEGYARAIDGVLADADWRVVVEGVRALLRRQDPHAERLHPVLARAVGRLQDAGQGHVLRETCLALADRGAPALSGQPVLDVVAALPADDATATARCTCAAAAVVLGADTGVLATCGPGTARAKDRRRLLTVEHARLSNRERATGLGTFLDHADPVVAVAAASAMCRLDGEHAADLAATRLLNEEDPGVATALLECFGGGRNATVLRDRTLAVVAQRFFAGATVTDTEPLVQVAQLAQGRGPGVADTLALLSSHPSTRVQVAARGLAHGARPPGPEALVRPTPAVPTLPLAATLVTTRGRIQIAFERELAPRTVQTFVELARKGTYKDTPFHRVVAGFVAQGGDPRGDGHGGPGFAIPCENSDAAFTRGAVGIATAGKDTGGSQFFITHSHQPHLDGRYTLFARVLLGLDVLDALQPDDLLLDVEVAGALNPRAGR
jgi:cyclophilin family peptidyl-prolyl cis-trans isomerase